MGTDRTPLKLNRTRPKTEFCNGFNGKRLKVHYDLCNGKPHSEILIKINAIKTLNSQTQCIVMSHKHLQNVLKERLHRSPSSLPDNHSFATFPQDYIFKEAFQREHAIGLYLM